MTTKKVQEAADGGGAGAEPKLPRARRVRYVVNRPYSAGEAPEIVTARVRREHEGDPDTLDLVVRGRKRGEEPQAVCARRSDRMEPGTWHEGGE